MKKNISSFEALNEAQKIAFSPVVFQTTIALRKLGILDKIFRSTEGISINDLSKDLKLTIYGVKTLLEMAESADIVVRLENGKYKTTKIGYFLNSYEMTTVNMDFINDVCYKGLFHLDKSIKNEKPEGLKELGEWDTIYEGLSSLEPQVKKSWFDFDHFYSDGAFKKALEIVFKNKPKLLFDIGGNTGKFATASCQYDNDVQVKILDLPGQLNVALSNAKRDGLKDRIIGHEIDLLSDNPKIPKGADAIWLSQFLDCFSKNEIVKILSACVDSMDENTELFIMETYTDRQKHENATFSLRATSLYFTAMANGNSKMYEATEMIELVEKSGLKVIDDKDNVGQFHTILTCKKL